MNCRHISNLLPDYSVDLLTGRNLDEVQHHLADCEPCRQELRALDAAATLIEQHGAVNPPAGLFNAVRNEIASPEFRRDRPSIWNWFQAPPVRALTMTAAAAALAFSLFSLRAPGPVNAPGGLPLALNDSNRSAIAMVVRQHAMSAADGPLADNVAWEAMARLAELELQQEHAPPAGP